LKKIARSGILFIVLMMLFACGAPPVNQPPTNGKNGDDDKPVQLDEVTPGIALPSSFPKFPQAVLTGYLEIGGFALYYTYTVKGEPFEIMDYLIREYRSYGLYAIGSNYSMYDGDYDIVLYNGTPEGLIVITLSKHYNYQGYIDYQISMSKDFDFSLKVNPIETLKIDKEDFDIPMINKAFLGRYEDYYLETYIYYLHLDYIKFQNEHLVEPYEQLVVLLEDSDWEVTDHGLNEYGINAQIMATNQDQTVEITIENWLLDGQIPQGVQIRIEIQP